MAEVAELKKPDAAKPAKGKKKADLNARILSKLRACKPRNESAGTFEVTRTSKEVLSKVSYVLTTGIEPFDDLVGGFPVGRITEVFGLESCGKTQLMIRMAVRGQTLKISQVQRHADGSVTFEPVKGKKIYVHVLYIDNECSIDEDEQIIVDGVEMDVHLARCDTVDQLFKMVDITVDEVVAAQKEDKDTLYFVVVLTDTIASTSSKEEMESDWGTVDYSRMPKQLREGFRVLNRKVNRANVAWICTNQVSDSFKAAAGGKRKNKSSTPDPDDFIAPGGKALKFFATHRVFMWGTQSNYKLYPTSKFASGLLIGFKSVKNRVKKPKREGRMVILFGDENKRGGGLNSLYSKLETMIYMGVAKMSESGKEISFLFNKHHVPTTTYGVAETKTTLDEDDEKDVPKRGNKNPSIGCRGEWAAYYEEHKTDLDALYTLAIKKAFAMEAPPEDGEDDDEYEEEA